MRSGAVFALLMMTALAGCFDDLPEQPSGDDGVVDDAPPAVTPDAYLHEETGRTWMDADADGPGTVLTETVSTASAATVWRFPLEPTLDADAVLGDVPVHVSFSWTSAVGPGGHAVVTLLVDGKARSTVEGGLGDNDVVLPAVGTILAGSDVALEVCICPMPQSIAYQYTFVVDGGSFVQFSQSTDDDEGAGGNTTGSSGSSSGTGIQKGSVSVEKQGDRWVARRTDTATAAVTATRGDVSLDTVNGAVTVTPGGDGSVLKAAMYAYGDSEQAARDSIAGMSLSHDAGTAGGRFHLDAQVTVTGDWQNRGASLSLTLRPITLDSLAVDTTNGAVGVEDFEGGSWSLDTTNGAVDASGVDVRDLSIDTSNGAVEVDGTVDVLEVDTTNGHIDLELDAAASGTWDVQTTNGGIEVVVPEDAQRGYDVTGDTTNGEVTISLSETEPVGSQSDEHKHERTTGFDGRAVKTTITLDTTNGDVDVL